MTTVAEVLLEIPEKSVEVMQKHHALTHLKATRVCKDIVACVCGAGGESLLACCGFEIIAGAGARRGLRSILVDLGVCILQRGCSREGQSLLSVHLWIICNGEV